MAKLEEIVAGIDALSASVVEGFSDIQTRVDALKSQIAAGGTITEADLDQVITKIEAVKADLVTREDNVK